MTDNPSTFLHADMEDEVHMLLEGYCRVNCQIISKPIQKTHLAQSEGQANAVRTAKKTLYGTLQAALLFWKLLSTTLQEWGFKINEYDQCMANKIIKGKQCTIIWHVDNLKITCGKESSRGHTKAT